MNTKPQPEPCANCPKPIRPGERRVHWFVKNAQNDTIERGAIHLHCLGKAS